ncbi:phosphatidylinositol N-acetylglucosaminyltransferas-like protein subunit C [Sporormia fimetaria CBS 119925]|uniref:Phosphatidylinositol N-acetylglucosaminyltransferas-like protein subunit C n=1 Tax=Sporormia fimetaria CBS 119925 TaxID=1340428 RepID=A0A6A6UU21_9PLEO|nr:phosphatidylinositol N-acetylglucosaminyltransferas-like protein subunit C [Sporormia fimetaria CBS 119925]
MDSSVPASDRLAPDDAFSQDIAAIGQAPPKKRTEGPGSSSRRRRRPFKKILWFKQPFPDNYTDEETFLDHLQRNPRLQPYQFWSLMADVTVVVQHVASVAIFCCCFVAIAQEKVSPVSVVSCATVCTVLGWTCWDYWVSQEDHDRPDSPDSSLSGTYPPALDTPAYQPPYVDPMSSLSPRNQVRLATAKSALLIYAALLGLSPILKSLTRSTTSDSIWALSTWLLCMNVLFFDYRGGKGAQLPASISTNSGLMASTVLASRLPSTTHVFSLTLFSIEIFGLFPIFRRRLWTESRHGHFALTSGLVVFASGGVFVTLTSGGLLAWVIGVILGGTLTFLAMGICSFGLMSLQKYKNEIHGPWDPARPIIRRS